MFTNLTEEEARKRFDEAYEDLDKDEKDQIPEADREDYDSRKSRLGDFVSQLFDEYERDRKLTEERWIKDLRQFRGEYDPETKSKLHPKRSKAFLSLTRTKVKTISARQTDLLFPANGDKNWGINTSPIPELNPQIIESIAAQYEQATGERPDEAMVRRSINTEAERRKDAMEKEMEDQLSELKYRSIVRQTIFDGNLYGTGILKGPLGQTVKAKRWLQKSEDSPWVTIELEKVLPYCENVSVWDCYPDMSARRPEDIRGIFQRHVMNRHKLVKLAKRSDFDKGNIESYIKINKDGDAPFRAFEQDLRDINDANDTEDTTTVNRKGKYEVLEFWGYVNTSDLNELGLDLNEDEIGLEVAANIWILGGLVIKAVVSPVEGVEIPYNFYYYDKDDSSIWGEGIPSIMRDSQKLFNAAVRAMLDNAAISAGPIIEANLDLLAPHEDPKDIFPFRVFLREGNGQDAAAPAIRVFQIPSYTNEFMAMINFFMNSADEVTAIPRYLYGDTQQVGGAGKTATGLSMLMGAANVTLKDQVKNFDDGITVPFIKGLYFWNMEFNSKEHIKGDFNVVARGSTSLIAREVKAESLMQFMSITNNEVDLAYVKRDNTLREFAKVLDLDELDLIKDKDTVAMEEEQRSKAAAEEREFEKQLAMTKAKSGGHMNDQAGLTPGMERLTTEQLESGQIPEVSVG